LQNRERALKQPASTSRGTGGSSAILAFQRELRARLAGAGRRPSDPAPAIRRLVTVKKQARKELQRQAAVLSRP
jgi:predicted nucleic acid-binding Zn ribbon protein